MAKITNLTNFTGTINGLVYYTVNGQQFLRTAPKKRSPTKPKELPKKILPGIEALPTNNALHSLTHVVNALNNEFQTLKTPAQPPYKDVPAAKEFRDSTSGQPSGSTAVDHSQSPVLEKAVSNHTEIKFRVSCTKTGLHLIILQISFKTGNFQRTKIALADAHCIRNNTYTVQTPYQPRKGYTDLLFLYGQNFLKSVAIQIKKNGNP